jgi:feruloyl esterase
MMLLFALAAVTSCSDLAKVVLPQTTIDRAETVTSGEAQNVKNLPSFCRVAGSIRPTADSDIRFEVWMPSTGWNGKFQGVGNGGFAGSIGYGGLGGAIRQGYAAASTDTGHTAGQGIDASWALNHPEKIVDYGHRAIHETAVKGKAIVAAFYGSAPKRCYFNACSNGGRQALMEAQRYPDDYDGIIAGAPANNFTQLLSGFVWDMKAILTEPGDYVPVAKLKAIEAAALSSCDANDKVTDGVIENPSVCTLRLDSLRCQGTESDSCLTAAQLTAVKKIYSGPKNSNGRVVFPGFSPGGEADPGGWGPWIVGKEREQSAQFGFGTQIYKNMVYSDPNWDFRSFDVDRDMKAAQTKMGPILDATDPDLRPFLKRGGKLILYHGWCDAAIPAQSTIDYYRSVEKKIGEKATRAGVRLFLAPGVQHCGGGAGPNVFGQAGPTGASADSDVNAALERWVEQGTAPGQIIATRRSGGRVERTRPLCAYPEVAQWKESGSTDDAANFECALPKR